MVIDKNGDRLPDFDIQIVNDGKYVTLFTYRALTETLEEHDVHDIVWSAGMLSPPTGEPLCGWDNEYCSKGEFVRVAVYKMLCGLGD